MTYTIKEVNCETGEEKIREATAAPAALYVAPCAEYSARPVVSA